MNKFTYIVALLFFCVYPFFSSGKGHSWEQVLTQSKQLQKSGDCTSAWKLIWQSRRIPNGYFLMYLSADAINGGHPYEDKSIENNIEVAGNLALLAALNGEFESYAVFSKYPEEKSAGLFLLQSSARAGLIHKFNLKGSVKQCFLGLVKIDCIENFANTKQELAAKFESELSAILSAPNALVGCITMPSEAKRK